jgi:hypothetical protein
MREQLQARLVTLRDYFAMEQIALEKVERQRTNLREMMERTHEEIQVLEVVLAARLCDGQHGAATHETPPVSVQTNGCNSLPPAIQLLAR